MADEGKLREYTVQVTTTVRIFSKDGFGAAADDALSLVRREKRTDISGDLLDSTATSVVATR